MSRIRPGAPFARCCLVWVAVSASCLGVLTRVSAHLPRRLAPDPAQLDAPPFEDLLATGCGVALAGCACWFWLVTTVVLVEAVTGLRVWQAGCPVGLRRAVLTLCGAALVAGSATQGPAFAGTPAGLPPDPTTDTDTDQRALVGLRLPERPVVGMTVGPGRRPHAVPGSSRTAGSAESRPEGGRLRIRPGDTLWALTESQLPDDATDADIAHGWQQLWRANRNLIGPDPDLIHPGGVLRLPDTKEYR